MAQTFTVSESVNVEVIMLDPRRSAAEAAIIWYLKYLYQTQKRGADAAEIINNIAISERTFYRAWNILRAEGILERNVIYTLKDTAAD